jgi:hypothetical protein
VDNSSVAERAFNWQAEFPDVFAVGGFDVVIGNPPYVRQELLSPIKSYLQAHYESYDGVADLYAYFYEKGLKILKLGGVLSYIVTNKWLRAGYGEPLRQFFSKNSVFEQIIDFGHAPIFEDADTFPCIVAVQKPVNSQASEIQELVKPEPQSPVLICPVPREKLSDINLSQYIQQEGYTAPWSRFTAEAWSLEPPAVDELMQKIKDVGVPLKDFTGIKPCYGIKTGLNEAFLIDEATKNNIVKSDPSSAKIIKPYLRGQDIKRWTPDWQNLWLVFTRHGIDIDDYPGVKAYLNHYREQLEPRPQDWDKDRDGEWSGRKPGTYKWYEIQDPVGYWELFARPKIVIQRIAFHSRIGFDIKGMLINDAAIMLPTLDFWVLACLNSPPNWYFAFRHFPHKKDEALSMDIPYVETIPIAPPTDEIRAEVEPIVSRLIEITKANQEAYRDVLDWLLIEQGIEKPGQKLEDFASLDADAFVQEVKKRKPKPAGGLSPAAIKAVRQVYSDYAPEIQSRKTEASTLEHRLSDLVNRAYGLTPEEIDLMWKTAPPRMPIRSSNKET